MAMIRLTAASAARVSADAESYPWNLIADGLDFKIIDGGSKLHGSGVVLVCQDPAITISGWQVDVLLGDDHPAVRACREDTARMIRERSRAQSKLARRRLLDR